VNVAILYSMGMGMSRTPPADWYGGVFAKKRNSHCCQWISDRWCQTELSKVCIRYGAILHRPPPLSSSNPDTTMHAWPPYIVDGASTCVSIDLNFGCRLARAKFVGHYFVPVVTHVHDTIDFL
jgi:hypothetical protein